KQWIACGHCSVRRHVPTASTPRLRRVHPQTFEVESRTPRSARQSIRSAVPILGVIRLRHLSKGALDSGESATRYVPQRSCTRLHTPCHPRAATHHANVPAIDVRKLVRSGYSGKSRL